MSWRMGYRNFPSSRNNPASILSATGWPARLRAWPDAIFAFKLETSAASAIFTRCFVSGQQRSLISSGCNIGRFVDFFDWDARLIRKALARFEFGRRLDNLSVELADLDRHLAESRLDRLEFALKLAP